MLDRALGVPGERNTARRSGPETMTTQHQVDKAKDLARSWQLQYEAERAEASGLRDQVQRLRQALQDVVEAHIDHNEDWQLVRTEAEAALDALYDSGYSLECPCCPANYRGNDQEQIASIADHGKCSACHREWQTTASDYETTNPGE